MSQFGLFLYFSERLFWYYVSMAVSMKDERNRKSGSGEAEPPTFTYQDRIHTFEGLDFPAGDSALSSYARLYGRLERRLFARYSAGDRLTSLKKPWLAAHGIPARMFNSLRVSVEGKISSVREGQSRRVDSLDRRIKNAERLIERFAERGDANGVHQKKRRLSALRQQFEDLKADISAGRVRLCFGSKRLWRKQYNLESNGYSCHDEWKADWKDARSGEFFILGSKDEKSGCQLCVATVQDDGRLALRLRLPDALAGGHGKYLVVRDIHFHNGHAQVLSALHNGDGQAISYRFKRDPKGWRVFATVKHEPVAVVTDRRLGAIGVDVNVDHLAVSEADGSGNWVRSWRVPLVTYGKSGRQAEVLIGDAAAGIVAVAREAGKPVVIEDLDFSKKKDLLEGEGPRRSRMLSSFAYGTIKAFFVSRGYREGVEIHQVNPAFSSVIGRVAFMGRYGLSVHQAAALVLARRLLGCSERIPRRRVAPVGNGVQVAFTVPVRKRVKHVWTYWGAVAGQLRPALAAQHRLGRRRSQPNPVQAGVQGSARAVV